MIIRRRSRFIPPQSIEGVERVKTTKVLGVVLSEDLSAGIHKVISPESLNRVRDLCMLSASYDPTVYPNPRFMKTYTGKSNHLDTSFIRLSSVVGLRQCF